MPKQLLSGWPRLVGALLPEVGWVPVSEHSSAGTGRALLGPAARAQGTHTCALHSFLQPQGFALFPLTGANVWRGADHRE